MALLNAKIVRMPADQEMDASYLPISIRALMVEGEYESREHGNRIAHADWLDLDVDVQTTYKFVAYRWSNIKEVRLTKDDGEMIIYERSE